MIEFGGIPITQQPSVSEARNKVRVLVESLTSDTMFATRIATATSEIARALLREGDTPRIDIALEANGNQSRLCLTLVDKKPLPDLHRIAGFFDEFGPERRIEDEHAVDASLLLPNRVDPRPHEIERLKTLIQQKSRDELMAEGLITNPDDFSTYHNGAANIRTRHLTSGQLKSIMDDMYKAYQNNIDYVRFNQLRKTYPLFFWKVAATAFPSAIWNLIKEGLRAFM